MADPANTSPSWPSMNQWESDFSAGENIFLGAESGTGKGQTEAAISAAKLGSNLKGFGSTSGAVGSLAADASNITNIVTGLQQGGPLGYGRAAVGAGMLTGSLAPAAWQAGMTTAGQTATMQAIGQYAGYAAIPLSLYNFAKNWQSGATGADALSGAETGATIGTAILPGIGTLVGAGLGAAAGALSSVFGGGKADTETTEWNQLAANFNKLPPDQQSQVVFSPQQALTNLAGVMDAKNNAPGHSQPIEQVFGRMGENNLISQMTQQINSQIASGAISPNASTNDIYNQVVAPWLASKGASINMSERTSTGQAEGAALVQSLKSVIAGWQHGSPPISGLQTYGQGYNPQAQQQQQALTQQVTQQFTQLIGGFPGRIARH